MKDTRCPKLVQGDLFALGEAAAPPAPPPPVVPVAPPEPVRPPSPCKAVCTHPGCSRPAAGETTWFSRCADHWLMWPVDVSHLVVGAPKRSDD